MQPDLAKVLSAALDSHDISAERLQLEIAENALGAAERNLYFNNVDLADREWTANNIGHVDQLLAASPTGMRNWEWRYLSIPGT